MSRERPASTRETATTRKAVPLNGKIKGEMKRENKVNPLLHKDKQYGQQKGGLATITFGQIRFDQNQHLLFVDANKGGEHIRCSITQDALRKCYNTSPNFDALQSCFKAHTGEISRALDKKWSASKWKDQSKEKGICLEEMDLREFMKH